MCITFEADQIISGTAINLLALGGTGFLMVEIFGSGGTSPRVTGFGYVAIPLLSDIPVIGAALFDQSVLVYLMYLLVPVVYFVVFRTPFGLRLRATGEVPEAVDTAGVNVQRMRYYGVALSGLLAACGGVYLSMGSALRLHREHDRRPRLHRARRPDLRPLEPHRRRRRRPALRLRPGHNLSGSANRSSPSSSSRCSPTS